MARAQVQGACPTSSLRSKSTVSQPGTLRLLLTARKLEFNMFLEQDANHILREAREILDEIAVKTTALLVCILHFVCLCHHDALFRSLLLQSMPPFGLKRFASARRF